jgi:hypothetical protein
VLFAKLFGINAEAMGAGRTWKLVGDIIGTVLKNIVLFGSGLFFIGALLVGLPLLVVGAMANIGKAIWSFVSDWWGFGWGLIANFVQGIVDGVRLKITVIKTALQWIADLFTGSEPKNRSSPLFGMGLSGAALLANMAMGMLAYAPTFGALAAQALRTAVNPAAGGAPSVGAVVAAPPTGTPAAAPGVGGGGITITIGQLVFQAPDMSPEAADQFAKMISERIAAELQSQIASSIG